jgi:alginate O-acetyltransferase complex protein AlgI
VLFTEWKFFVFFAVVLAVYWPLRSNALRKFLLLIASAFFYAMWDWRFLGLVALVIVNTYIVTLLVVRVQGQTARRGVLTAGIAVSLAVLGFFKYWNFFADTVSGLLGGHFTLSILLPVGISFYTFHAMSYMIDSYRGKIVPTWNFADVALYILFFPQLIAGPIVRATDLLPQMLSARAIKPEQARYFLILFLVGYFKKAVVSDNIAAYVDLFFSAPQHYGAIDAATAVLFYAVQIYCDFAGYTDMAIATAGLLGYALKPNFAHPYLAPNLIEFWRRWNMSLSFWLRDYLYIPLGGNHGSFAFQTRNILITMLLGGLWHGASWTFVVWGLLHGMGLIVNHAYRLWSGHKEPARYSLAGNLLTFAWVCAAWVFFRSPSFHEAWQVFACFGDLSPPELLAWPWALAIMAVLTGLHVLFYRLDLRALAAGADRIGFAILYGAAVAIILPFVNVDVRPFIYFQF